MVTGAPMTPEIAHDIIKKLVIHHFCAFCTSVFTRKWSAAKLYLLCTVHPESIHSTSLVSHFYLKAFFQNGFNSLFTLKTKPHGFKSGSWQGHTGHSESHCYPGCVLRGNMNLRPSLRSVQSALEKVIKDVSVHCSLHPDQSPCSCCWKPSPQHDAATTRLHCRDRIGQVISSSLFPPDMTLDAGPLRFLLANFRQAATCLLLRSDVCLASLPYKWLVLQNSQSFWTVLSPKSNARVFLSATICL